MLTRVSPGVAAPPASRPVSWSDRQVPRRVGGPAGTAATPAAPRAETSRRGQLPALSSGGFQAPRSLSGSPWRTLPLRLPGETRVHRWRNAGSSYLEDVE